MASVVILTTILIVVSTLVKSQQTLLHNHLKKSVPLHFWEHDKEKLNRYVEQDARGPQVRVGPRLAPLFTQQTLDQWQGAGRAVHTDEGIKKVRVNLLKSKLMPQASQQRKIVAHRKVFPKPETNQYQRHKRDVDQTKGTKIKEEVEAVRKKRQVMLNALPEMVMQPHIQPALPQDKETKYQEKVKEKRDKRQIIYLINRQPLLFANKPKRTTPNPFNREADIADYEIVRPTPEGIIPAPVETDEGIDTGSYLLSDQPNVLSQIRQKLLNLMSWFQPTNGGLALQIENGFRIKRSPKMSKLYKKQKLAKKKRKKKKQQKQTPRQIKHFRRIREHREERRKILHKRLKEKQRLRHKKMGTGPYNKTIVDYFGVYFDPPSSQINDSLYDSVYDTSEVDSEAIYEEHKKDYPENYEEEEEEEESEEKEEEEFEEESEDMVGSDSESRHDEEKETKAGKALKEPKNKTKPT